MEFSIGSIFKYLFYTVVGYVLVGSPLLRIFLNERPQHPDLAEAFARSDRLVIPDENLVCPDHGYNVHVLSRDPLVIYIPGFVSAEEAKHMVAISEDKFKPSTVWTGEEERLDPSVRVSEKAEIERDEVVQCIEERARLFQGWRPFTFIEKLWTQRYVSGGHYSYHFDGPTNIARGGRISSFMVYLDGNCTGGGTNFPRLEMPPGRQWCQFLDCDDRESEGITFKPIAGNAVYWENFRPDGSGYEEAWHAGLPVRTGTKVGLNIWSWYQPGYDPKAVADNEQPSDKAEL
ncbi:hypothetical protein SLS58_008779 [Diplodia intermedia]|uniref:Prolyl 4-hydroxylase alpha subunit domain-containing protein n=1 Tax=Diplodia intermedia TaxID=856260 RepID=A0ABR3TGK2_9PEZI